MTTAAEPTATPTLAPAAPDVRPSLRDHVQARLIIDEFLLEHDGELTDELADMLRDVETATADKVERIAWFYKEERAKIGGIKTMNDTLTKRRKAIENRMDWLCDVYLREMLTLLGKTPGDPLKGTLSTVRFQWNNHKLTGEVTESALIERFHDVFGSQTEKQYVTRMPATFTLNRQLLLTDLKAAHALLDGLEEARQTLGRSDATAKEIVAAKAVEDTATQDMAAAARALIEAWPELRVERELSVRIA